MASDSNELEQELRRNLRLRQQLGAKAAKAEHESANQGALGGSTVAGAKTTTCNSGLEELRRELTLRREIDTTELEDLRLELRLRRADPAATKKAADVQRQEHQWRAREIGNRWPNVVRKAWVLGGLVCLVVAVFLIFWLIYG
jgi:hypothetical protein